MDRHGASASNHTVLRSSPPLPSSSPSNALLSPTRSSRRKERRDPSVTPRRFGRFFTPRSSQPIPGRRILSSIASEELNRQQASPASSLGDCLDSDPLLPSSPSRAPVSPRGHGQKRGVVSGHSEPIIRRRGLLHSDMPPPHLELPERPDLQNNASQGAASQDVLGDWRKATLVCTPEL